LEADLPLSNYLTFSPADVLRQEIARLEQRHLELEQTLASSSPKQAAIVQQSIADVEAQHAALVAQLDALPAPVALTPPPGLSGLVAAFEEQVARDVVARYAHSIACCDAAGAAECAAAYEALDPEVRDAAIEALVAQIQGGADGTTT
jgi:hypothetical protein